MKKKIIAFALVLMLTLAMMLPAFAAEPRACSHNWLDSGNIVITGYTNNNDYATHRVHAYVPQICTLCAVAGTRDASFTEAHTGLYCSKCGAYTR